MPAELATQARATISANHKHRSTAAALIRVVPVYLLFIANAIAVAIAPEWWIKWPLSMLSGLGIAVLFVLGHDAVHGSLTPYPSLNRFLGAILLLPSLHSYTAWRYSHNTLHHGWTNLRGRDPGYPPLTVDEYRAMPPLSRTLHRFMRSLPGLGALYIITVWWPLEFRPQGEYAQQLRKRGNIDAELLLVKGYAVLWLTAAVVVPFILQEEPTFSAVAASILGVCVLPWLIWNWLMGWATFQHHTHPRVRWYESLEEWRNVPSQLTCSVHVVLPRVFGLIIQDIMQHTAHHVDPRIPSYNLAPAQAALQSEVGQNILTEPFSLRALRRTLSVCKLYDYRQHAWLDWDGRVTAFTDGPSVETASAA